MTDKEDDFELEDGEYFVPVLTNNPSELINFTVDMIYTHASIGHLGYMDGKHPETGEIIPLLCGFDPLPGGNGFAIYPIARFLGKDDPKQYLVPDGAGNYITGEGLAQLSRDAALREEEAGPPEGIDKAKLH